MGLKIICFAVLYVAILNVGSVVYGDGWRIQTQQFDCNNVIQLQLTKYTGTYTYCAYIDFEQYTCDANGVFSQQNCKSSSPSKCSGCTTVSPTPDGLCYDSSLSNLGGALQYATCSPTPTIPTIAFGMLYAGTGLARATYSGPNCQHNQLSSVLVTVTNACVYSLEPDFESFSAESKCSVSGTTISQWNYIGPEEVKSCSGMDITGPPTNTYPTTCINNSDGTSSLAFCGTMADAGSATGFTIA